MDPLRANPFRSSQSGRPARSPGQSEPSSPILSPRSRDRFSLEDDLAAVKRNSQIAKERYPNDPTTPFESSDAAREDRFQRLKDAKPNSPGWYEKYRAKFRDTFITSQKLKGSDIVFEWKDRATGKTITQTRTAGFAEATDARRLANSLHRNILERAQGVLHDITSTVRNPEQYGVFARKVFADEAVEAHYRNQEALENAENTKFATRLRDEAIERGDPTAIREARAALADAIQVEQSGPKFEHREPGETLEGALKDQADIDAILAKSPGLKSAYDRHLSVLHSIRDELIARGLIRPTDREFYFPHYIVDYLQEQAPKNLPRGVGLSRSKSVNTKGRVGGREWSRDYVTAMATYLTRNLEMVERHNLLDEIAYKYHVTSRPMASILRAPKDGQSDYDLYLTKGIIPRGYVRYSLASGYTKPRASSLGEREFGELLDNVLPDVAKKLGIAPYIFDQTISQWVMNPELSRSMESRVHAGKVNDNMPQAGTEMVIPKELADELTIMAKGTADLQPIQQSLENKVRLFKTLAIHTRPLQYNVRNVIGDMNRAIAQFGVTPLMDAKMWKESAHEVVQATLKHNYIGDWPDAQRGGIMSSGRTAVETTKLRDIDSFRKLTGDPPNLNTVQEWAKWIGAHPAQMREDIFRLYLYKMNKARGVDNMLMGAVDPEYVNGLARNAPTKAFAAIARRSLIDFGDFTPSEDFLRNGLVPFYSWVKGNLSFWARDLPKAYGRAIMHAADGKVSSSDAHAIQGAAVVTALAATAVIWNNQNKEFTDAQERLADQTQRQTHIILPDLDQYNKTGKMVPLKNSEGRPVVIAVPDAMDDALDAVGMGGATADLVAVMKGHMPVEEFIARRKEQAYKGPINYGVRALGPVPNFVAAVGGLRTYPDVFEAHSVRPEQRVQNIAGSLALSNIPFANKLIETIPGQIATPNKTLDPIAQSGYSEPQTTRMPYYQESLLRKVKSQYHDVEETEKTMKNIAGGLSEPQLTKEQRAARVAQYRRLLDVRVAELRRVAERFKALQRTQNAQQR